ncbi:MAG: hypothetical protein Q7U47_00425 [Paludibacter sp.]|nr:hypothetical protein [Paludibacter sp.]
MRKYAANIVLAVFVVSLLIAQQKIKVFKSDKSIISYSTSTIDSLKFRGNSTVLDVYKNDKTVANFLVAEIDSVNMNGGIFVGAGSSSSMTKAMSTTSTQPNFYISSRALISSATMMTVTIGGTSVVSFIPKYGGYKFLISTPTMTKGAAYVVYTGGSYSGGTSTNNLFLGGTFSSTGATTKKSGTLSATATVNTISF